MKIACSATSIVPSDSANSIQVMKVCGGLAQVAGSVSLWIPGEKEVPWKDLAVYYGLGTSFDVRWVYSRQVFRRYDFAWHALRQGGDWGADLLYTWMPQVGLAALLKGLPAILELHGPPTGRIGPLALKRFLHHPGQKRLLVITHALHRILERDFGITDQDSHFIQVAPNGVDIDHYTHLAEPNEARLSLGLPEKFTIGYTGHLYAGRGIDLLLRLAKAIPQVNFLWIGGKPDDVDQWRKKLTVAHIDNVQLTGFIENQTLPIYQAACEILLMPYESAISGSSGGNSAEYCSPMKMFDYLAVGRAIVTSDLPVFHEILNEKNAVFCPVGDFDAWHMALNNLIADGQKRVCLSTQAKNDASQYSWYSRELDALAGF
jgi:glycosyltransferase involved in cell wall biosynthesis